MVLRDRDLIHKYQLLHSNSMSWFASENRKIEPGQKSWAKWFNQTIAD